MKKGFIIYVALMLAASMAGCSAQAGLGASDVPATTESQRGHFEDVQRWDGAVVGTRYEEATEEIGINVKKETGKIVAELELFYPEEFPYCGMVLYGLQSYEIVDGKDRVVQKGNTTALAEVAGDQVSVSVPLGPLEAGEYKLIIREIVASSSAEDPFTNPLVIAGEWDCEFTW